MERECVCVHREVGAKQLKGREMSGEEGPTMVQVDVVQGIVQQLATVTGGTESVLPVPWPSGQPERRVRTEKQSTGWNRATLGRAWFLSPLSWFLGF